MQTVISEKNTKSFERLGAELNEQAKRQFARIERHRKREVRKRDLAQAAADRSRERERVAYEEKIRPRIEAANAGLAALIALAKSPAVQGFLKARGDIAHFSFYDADRLLPKEGDERRAELSVVIYIRQNCLSIEMGTHWDWLVTELYLYEPVEIEAHGPAYWVDSFNGARVSESPSYRTYEDYVESIATIEVPDAMQANFPRQQQQCADWTTQALAFQVLVDCANPDNLNRYLDRALKHYEASSKNGSKKKKRKKKGS